MSGCPSPKFKTARIPDVHNAHRIEMRGESMRKHRGEKGEKRKIIGGRKAVEEPGKKRPWKSLRDSHFSTAPATMIPSLSLTIMITFSKILSPASLRSDD